MSTDPLSYTYADDEIVSIKELVQLYEAVGWLVQAADPDALAKGVDRATYLVTARDEDGALIGLIRCLSDDVTVMVLQDVLVHPGHRLAGVGRFLVEACASRFAHVQTRIALSDVGHETGEFYETCDFAHLTSGANSSLITYSRSAE